MPWRLSAPLRPLQSMLAWLPSFSDCSVDGGPTHAATLQVPDEVSCCVSLGNDSVRFCPALYLTGRQATGRVAALHLGGRRLSGVQIVPALRPATKPCLCWCPLLQLSVAGGCAPHSEGPLLQLSLLERSRSTAASSSPMGGQQPAEPAQHGARGSSPSLRRSQRKPKRSVLLPPGVQARRRAAWGPRAAQAALLAASPPALPARLEGAAGLPAAASPSVVSSPWSHGAGCGPAPAPAAAATPSVLPAPASAPQLRIVIAQPAHQLRVVRSAPALPAPAAPLAPARPSPPGAPGASSPPELPKPGLL